MPNTNRQRNPSYDTTLDHDIERPGLPADTCGRQTLAQIQAENRVLPAAPAELSTTVTSIMPQRLSTMGIDDVLTDAKLSHFADAIEKVGAADGRDLADMDDASLKELGMKDVEIKRLRRQLAKVEQPADVSVAIPPGSERSQAAGVVPRVKAVVQKMHCAQTSLGLSCGRPQADKPAANQTPPMMYVLVGLSTLTSILLVVLLGTVASLSSTVDSTVASLSTAAEMAEQSSILRDGLAATFDEGRMRSMLTAGALFAQKVGDINWELDPDRDDDLCYMRQLYDGTTYRSCPVEIDSRDQNDIEDVCEKAGDIMTDLASGLSTEVQVELDHIPNLHDMLKGLFQADWATFATSCEQVATQVKEADWEDIGVSSRDAGEIQAYAHAVAKTCEKIERRWN